MKMLVTGGTGFLGRRVVQRLLADGHEVNCLVRQGSDRSELIRAVEGSRTHQLTVIAGDLGCIPVWLNRARGCEVLIHGAAAMTGATAPLFLDNVVGTRELIAAVRGIGIKRFVLISSMGVFGPQSLREGEVVNEATPLDRRPQLRDPYSYSKIEQERLAWEAHARRDISLVVVRPGVIFGPGRGCLSSRIGLRLGNLLIKMGGHQQVPYTYVDNCAAAVALAATVEGAEGESFNIVDDDLPRANEVLGHYQRQVRRLRVLPVPTSAISMLSGLCEWYHKRSHGQLPAVLTRHKSMAMWKDVKYSNLKAKRMLGWSPAVGFAEAIRRTCDWSRQHPDAA